jgi:hypothetical protein
MVAKKIVSKLLLVVLGLSVVAMSLAGCGKVKKKHTKNMNQTDTINTTSLPEIDTQQDNNLAGSEIPFKPMNKLPTELPFQKGSDGFYEEGIFYFNDQNPENLIFEPGNNAWLIQLSNIGKRVEVDRIEKSGNIYDIYVHRRWDLDAKDSSKPSFGFFQVGVNDIPITAHFRIYDIDIPNEPIWPRN